MLTPWVASRWGFTNSDWGGAFLSIMAEFKLPGSDFLILEPKTFSTFGSRLASYTTMVVYVRFTLIQVGLTPREAIDFTLHGFRQLYPTMAT